MVKMVNKTTGSFMYVSEDRLEEYKAAGHKLAANTSKPAKQSEPKAKKTTKKK